jgi:hypothetical protein
VLAGTADVAAQLVSGTLEALGHAAPPRLTPADASAILALYEQAVAELGRSVDFCLSAAASVLDEAAGYFLGLVPGFPGPLPWGRPGADVLGDIREVTEAGSGVPAAPGFPAMLPLDPLALFTAAGMVPPEVTIRSTDSPGRISPEVRTRADPDRTVQIGDRTWTPGHP